MKWVVYFNFIAWLLCNTVLNEWCELTIAWPRFMGVHCYWLVNLPENYSVGPKVSGAIQCWDVKTGARILDVKIGFKISGRARFWDVNIGQKNWRVLRWGRRERWWCPQRRAYHPSLLPANGGGTQFSGWVRVGTSELGVSEIGTWLVFQVEN